MSRLTKQTLPAVACVWLMLSAAAGAAEWNAEAVEALIARGVVLSCDVNSASDQFQFELHLRVIREDGSRIEQRAVGERAQGRCAVLLLSPLGFPSSLAAEDAFWVVDRDRLMAYQGGCFDCRAGITSSGVPGLEINSAAARLANSTITLDVGALVRFFRVEGATSGWDQIAQRYWIRTPKGAQVSVFLERSPAHKDFPFRAIAISGKGRGGKGQMEMVISGFHLGAARPLALGQFRPSAGTKLAPVSYADIKTSHFGSLGTTFDERDPLSRVTGESLLAQLIQRESLRLDANESRRLRDAVGQLESPEPAALSRVFGILRGLGGGRIWDAPQGRSPAGAEYDSTAAARRTEIVFGPEATAELRSKLAGIVMSNLPDALRCDALELLGRFGLPLLSPLLADIEISLAAATPALQAAGSALRIRHARGDHTDVQRLQQVVRVGRLSPSLVSFSLEALAAAGQLDAQAEQFAALCAGEGLVASETLRRSRAVATCEKGRSFLLGRLVDGRLNPGDGLAVLLESMTESDSDWPRWVSFCRGLALDQAKPAELRAIANRAVHRDAPSLASKYPEEFLQSVLGTDNSELLYGAFWNLVKIGRSPDCYRVLAARLLDAEPRKRVDSSALAVAVTSLELDLGQRVAPACWGILDKLFLDSDPGVRRNSAILILTLLDHRIDVPQGYVEKLADGALAAADAEQLALFSAALKRLAGPDCLPPLPENVKTYEDVIDWHRGNSSEIRQHLRKWISRWKQQQAQGERD